jgi:hypothetical protein
MSTLLWIGAAKRVAQVNTVTPANVGIGNVFKITINGKVVSFTATAATVANVTAGIVTALRACTEPEFTELTYTDNVTAITITGNADGTPFVATSSATGGTATFTTVVTTAASGPHSFNTAANWAGGVAPAANDTILIDNTNVSILYDLEAYAADTLTVVIGANFTGTIGLPETNIRGYHEYRPTFMVLKSASITVGQGQGQGSGRIKIKNVATTCTITIYNTGAPLEQGFPSLIWWCSDSSSHVVNVMGGSVSLGLLPGGAGDIATLRVGSGEGGNAPQVWGGSGLVVATLDMIGGEVKLFNGLTTLNQIDGTLVIDGSSASTTLNVDGGTLIYRSSGTITTLRVSDGGKVDFAQDLRTRTVTNCTLNAGFDLSDKRRTVTWSTPIVLNRCAIADGKLDLGTHITLAPAAGA